MPKQEDSFFRNVTSSLCSSVDIATSMHRALLQLRKKIPIDLMIIWVYDETQGGLRKVAVASEEGGRKSNELMQLHPTTREKLLRMDIPHTVIERTGLNPVVMRIVNYPDDDPVAHSLEEYFLPKDYSSMVMYLDSEGKRIGTLFVRTEGTNRYEPVHARLLSQFLEPFTLVAANALHQEMFKSRQASANDQTQLNRDNELGRNSRIVGSEYGLKNVIDMATQVARLSSPVLLRGETGTPMRRIARAKSSFAEAEPEPFTLANLTTKSLVAAICGAGSSWRC